MKVTLVRPRINFTMIPPLGILYIGTLLEEQGHQVQVVDPLPDDNVAFLKTIKEFGPDLIGLSLTTTQYTRAQKVLELIRPIAPDAFYIAGGVHPTAEPKRTLKEFSFDAIVIGEGELTAADLINCLEKKGDLATVAGLMYVEPDGTIVRNAPREAIFDVNSIAVPKRDFLNFTDYLTPPGNIRGFYLKRATTMIASRGCPYNCIFCGSNVIFGRTVRRRSVDNVMEEVHELKNKYNIDGLWFLDDTFTLDPAWVMELCQRFIDEHVDVTWGCQVRVNTVGEELLIKMKEAGCVQVDIGVESGSLRVLKAMKKGTTPEKIEEAFTLIRKVGMRTLATFMLGNPEETHEDIEKTYQLIGRIKPNYVAFAFTTPFPGTELNKMAVENGWIPKEYNFSAEWAVRDAELPVMEVNFSKKELQAIRSRLQNKYLVQNFISYLKQPIFLMKVFVAVMRYPGRVYNGTVRCIRTRRFEFLLEGILSAYRESLIKRQK